MTYLLDNLPLDMIHYEIFPYLDYNSRVTANVMLPPQDRISVPLKKDCAILFALHNLANKGLEFSKMMKQPGSNLVISRRYMKFGRNIHELFFVCQYRLEIREAMVAILTGFSNPDYEKYQQLSPYVKKNLPPLVTSQLETLQTKFPFIREVALIKASSWTPISGHPAHPFCEAEAPEFMYVRPLRPLILTPHERRLVRRWARGYR